FGSSCYSFEGKTSFIFTDRLPDPKNEFTKYMHLHEVGHCIYSGNYPIVATTRRFEIIAAFMTLFILVGFTNHINWYSFGFFVITFIISTFIVYKNDERLYENYADLFALINMNHDERNSLKEIIEKYPAFNDPNLHAASNRKRHTVLLQMIADLNS